MRTLVPPALVAACVAVVLCGCGLTPGADATATTAAPAVDLASAESLDWIPVGHGVEAALVGVGEQRTLRPLWWSPSAGGVLPAGPLGIGNDLFGDQRIPGRRECVVVFALRSGEELRLPHERPSFRRSPLVLEAVGEELAADAQQLAFAGSPDVWRYAIRLSRPDGDAAAQVVLAVTESPSGLRAESAPISVPLRPGAERPAAPDDANYRFSTWTE
jgi:hypothetical protein